MTKPNQDEINKLLKNFNTLKELYQINPKDLRHLAAQSPKEGEDTRIGELRILRTQIKEIGEQINALLNPPKEKEEQI